MDYEVTERGTPLPEPQPPKDPIKPVIDEAPKNDWANYSQPPIQYK